MIMGMSIDEADTILTCERLDSSMGCGASDEDIDEALGVAIETMRKYQKIRQIAFPLQFCSTDKLEHEAIMKICEVIEDGNDD